MKKKLPIEIIWLLIILIATFFFRFYHYASFSLSNDELSAINRLNFNTLQEMIQQGIRPDGHPAGAQLLLWFWTHIFGMSPSSVRFPFVFISALSPLFGYLFLKRITGSAPALLFAAALAFLSFPQLYGQIARPYGIGLTFTLMAAYFWIELILGDSSNKTRTILITISLSISWVLNLYTHYFSGFVTIIMGISGFFFLKKNNYKYYIIASIATALFFLPHFSISLHQLSLGGVGSWLAKPDSSWFWHHILFIFNDSFAIIILTLIMVLMLYLSGQKQKIKLTKLRITLFIWFFIPFLTGFLYSVFVNPVLQNSVLIFSMPFLFAFLLSFVPRRLTQTNRIAIIAFSLLLISHTFFIKAYYKQQHFAEFEQVPIVLSKWQQKYPDNQFLNLAQLNHPNYLRYYIKQQNSNLNFVGRNFKTEDDLNVLKHIIDTTTADYISFSDIQNGASHIALSIIASKYPNLIESKTFGLKTDMWLFKKNQGEEVFSGIDTLYSNDEYMGGKEVILRHDYGDSNLLDIKVYYRIHIATFTPETHLVYDIQDNQGKSLVWKSFPIRYTVGVSRWKTAVLYDKMLMKDNYYKIKIYLWNPGKEKIGIKSKKINIKYLLTQ